MKYIITESKMNEILNRVLNIAFEGFDDVYYDWANYGCGMGECCDPYAIGFVLPKSHYDDYLFKYVDGKHYDDMGDYPRHLREELPEPCHESPDLKDPRFDTIVFYEEFVEKIEGLLGSGVISYEKELLNFFNKKFRLNATSIYFI
jgi:hypothetical protein